MDSCRRSFLKKNVLIGSGLLIASSLDAIASASKFINTQSAVASGVTIMYTNDLLGKVNATYKDLGGLDALHSTIQNAEVSALLFDAGGFLNPHHNLPKQLKGIDLMNRIGYHAVNMSAADLSQGLARLEALLPSINFQLLSCNYRFDNPQIQKAVNSYQILTYGKFKIGVTGVGEECDIAGLRVAEPNQALQKTAALLKEVYHCDVVICLAHLGFDEKRATNNKKLAKSSTQVDLVIGGNAKMGQSQLWVLKNAQREDVLLSNNYQKGFTVATLRLNYNESKQRTGLAIKRDIPGLVDRKELSKTLLSYREQVGGSNA